MQTAVTRGCQGLKPLGTRRSVARVPAFSSTTSRRSSVQVYAKKGKGKTAFRQGAAPGQMEMMKKEPPTPEVDPQNEEIVLFFRCMKYTDPQLNIQAGPSPWVPLTIIKGNNVMNYLANAVKTEWGNKLYGRFLIYQITGGLYQDRPKLEKDLRKQFPPFAKSAWSDFQFAFKIRDKANPKDYLKPEGLAVCPPEAELAKLGPEVLKKFFSLETFTSMFKGGQEGAAPAAQQQQQR